MEKNLSLIAKKFDEKIKKLNKLLRIFYFLFLGAAIILLGLFIFADSRLPTESYFLAAGFLGLLGMMIYGISLRKKYYEEMFYTQFLIEKTDEVNKVTKMMENEIELMKTKIIQDYLKLASTPYFEQEKEERKEVN